MCEISIFKTNNLALFSGKKKNILQTKFDRVKEPKKVYHTVKNCTDIKSKREIKSQKNSFNSF